MTNAVGICRQAGVVAETGASVPLSGRKGLGDREAPQAVLFVLHTGIAWRHLPLELGFGSGATCYRRMAEWQEAGVWERLHGVLLDRFGRGGDRVVTCRRGLESCSGEYGSSETGPSPVDRGRNGSKHHLLVDGKGTPLAWKLTGGNRHGVTQLIPLVDAIPPVRGIVGWLRRRPDRGSADRAYDSKQHRRELRQRRIAPEIARRKTAYGLGLGRYRWVVERTFAWLHKYKRLLVRYDRRAEIHEAFLALGCCRVCFNRLQRSL